MACKDKDKRAEPKDRYVPVMVYLLLDSRANLLMAELESDNINDSGDDDWERFVLFASEEVDDIIASANSGELGDNCIVADMTGHVYLEWFNEGKWEKIK